MIDLIRAIDPVCQEDDLGIFSDRVWSIPGRVLDNVKFGLDDHRIFVLNRISTHPV